MKKEINITVENRLVREKRDMNVYHHSTGSAHLISHDSSITLPLKTVIEDDYLHISIVSGSGRLQSKSVVNLPSWADFEFSYRGDVTVAYPGDRTLVKIPPGHPTWQIKMTRSLSSLIDKSTDHIIIDEGKLED